MSLEDSSRHPAGYGIIAFLFVLLGLALTGAGVALTTRFLIDERNIAATRERLRRFAFAISRAQFSTQSSQQRQYESDVGAPPAVLADLLTKPGPVAACALNGAQQKLTGWCGPYVEKVFQGESTFGDAWGTALVYSSAARTLRSNGPDRADNGGAGDDLVQGF